MKTAIKTQGSVSLNKGLQIRGHEIVQNQAFVDFVIAQKELQEQIDEGWAMLQTIMEDEKIPTIKGEWGHVTLATRVTLKAEIDLPPRFYKQVLDPSKVKAHKTLRGAYPDGIIETKTTYLSKKVNA